MTIQIFTSNLATPQKLSEMKNIFQMTLEEAVIFFLNTLKPITKKAYANNFRQIFNFLSKYRVLTKDISLQEYSQFNPSNILDYIRENYPGALASKQVMSATYISFTKYLDRSSGGLFKVAVPKRGLNSTFSVIRRKAKTGTITTEQWGKFIDMLNEFSYREGLVARAIYQGAKRIEEVLSSTIDQIDWKNRTITYMQNKTLDEDAFTIISYPASFMDDLKKYIGARTQGYIFCCKSGTKILADNVRRSFTKVSKSANLPHIHPHMLRTSAITHFFKIGYHSDDIMKVSGHHHSSGVLYYDKSPLQNNLTKHVNLVC